MPAFTESVVEDAGLAWLDALGYAVKHGPDIAAGEPDAERTDPNYRDTLLEGRLRQALVRLNPDLPPDALDDAYRKLTRLDAPSLVERNRSAHRILVDGITVEYRRKAGSIAGAQVRLIDFDEPGKGAGASVSVAGQNEIGLMVAFGSDAVTVCRQSGRKHSWPEPGRQATVC